MGGNLYEAKPEAGIYDGSYSQLLKGDGTGNFVSVDIPESNLLIKGAVRDIKVVKAKKEILIISKNNDKVEVIELK